MYLFRTSPKHAAVVKWLCRGRVEQGVPEHHWRQAETRAIEPLRPPQCAIPAHRRAFAARGNRGKSANEAGMLQKAWEFLKYVGSRAPQSRFCQAHRHETSAPS